MFKMTHILIQKRKILFTFYKGKKKEEYFTGSRVGQLFNIKKDTWETTNLSFLPEYQELLKEMQQEMKAQAKELGDNKATIDDVEVDFWDYYN